MRGRMSGTRGEGMGEVYEWKTGVSEIEYKWQDDAKENMSDTKRVISPVL